MAGGEKVSRPAAFSYNALLGFKLFPTDKVCIENGGKYNCSKSYYGCGGSVINKWHVITSMKCLRRKAIKGNEQYLRYSAFPNKRTGCVKSTGTTFGASTEPHSGLTKLLYYYIRNIFDKYFYDF